MSLDLYEEMYSDWSEQEYELTKDEKCANCYFCNRGGCKNYYDSASCRNFSNYQEFVNRMKLYLEIEQEVNFKCLVKNLEVLK